MRACDKKSKARVDIRVDADLRDALKSKAKQLGYKTLVAYLRSLV